MSRITDPVVQTGPDTWTIRFNKVGLNSPRRPNTGPVVQTGDAYYKSGMQ